MSEVEDVCTAVAECAAPALRHGCDPFGNLSFAEAKVVARRKLFFDKADFRYEAELSGRLVSEKAIKFESIDNGTTDLKRAEDNNGAEKSTTSQNHLAASPDMNANAFEVSSSLRMIQVAYADSELSSPTASPRKKRKLFHHHDESSSCSSASSSRSSSVSSISSAKSLEASTQTPTGTPPKSSPPGTSSKAVTPPLPTSPLPRAKRPSTPVTVVPPIGRVMMPQRSPQSSSRPAEPTAAPKRSTTFDPSFAAALAGTSKSSPTTSGVASCSTPSVTTNGSSVSTASFRGFHVGPSRAPLLDAGDQRPSTSKGVFDDNRQAASPSTSLNGIQFAQGDTATASLPKAQRNGTSQMKVVNGAVKVTRKRLLSERGEAAAKYPVVDRRSLVTSWQGCSLLRNGGRNVGVGLLNHSNDCFLNAVLQTMVHTAPLARYVAEQHSSVHCNTLNCFVCAMGAHVRRAITSTSPFKAQWIQPFLRRIFPSHTQGLQEDAHELFTLILDALDPAPPTDPQHRGTPLSNSSNLKDVVLSTPVEQIFGGTLRNQTQCLVCSEKNVSYERIRELNLGMRMRKRDGPVRMGDLLFDYFGNETINTYDCRKCRTNTQAQRSSRVLRAPNVLLVQLKRFNAFGSKVKLPVHIEVDVRLDRFMFHSEDKNHYELCAVIEHMGTGLDHGHYVAYVRGFDGKTWHQFDDETCSRVSEEFVCSRQAYVMVYTLKESETETAVSLQKTGDAVQNRFANKNRFVRHATPSATTVLSASQMWPSHAASAMGRAGAA